MKTATEIAQNYKILEICKLYDGESCASEYDCPCVLKVSSVQDIIHYIRNKALEEAVMAISVMISDLRTNSDERDLRAVGARAVSAIRALKEPTP